MNEAIGTKPPIWFWIVAAVLLIWNILGVMAYFGQVMATPETLAQTYSAEELEIIARTPSWATSAFAIAVFAGLVGVIFLLLRRAFARSLFILSLIAVLVQHVWTFFLSGFLDIMAANAAFFPIIVVIICLFQIWFAHLGIKRGWLR